MPAELEKRLTYWYIIRKLEVLVENWWTKKKKAKDTTFQNHFLGGFLEKNLEKFLEVFFDES